MGQSAESPLVLYKVYYQSAVFWDSNFFYYLVQS